MKKRFYLYVLSFVLFAISSAIFVTIIFKPLFSWFLNGIDTQYALGLSKQVVSDNYNQLLAYLLNPFQSVLALSDIPMSSSGAFHFSEVKNLFLLNNVIFVLTFFTSWYSLKQVAKAQVWDRLARAGKWLAVVPPVIGLVFASSFDFWFILFHQVTFGNNDWLFDPRTDPIILVLPEDFFMACFILIAALIEIWFLFIWLYSRFELKMASFDKD